MSRCERMSHVIWHCQCHLIYVQKYRYRYRILKGKVAKETHNSINIFSGQLGCQIIELNIQAYGYPV